jgi:putative PIN family toxin of toxin-antitoxin system
MSRQPGRPRVVFDCNVLLQTMAFDQSLAAQAFGLMEAGVIEVFLSRTTLAELRRVLCYEEVLAISPHMTPMRISAFVKRLTFRATMMPRVPLTFAFKRDPDDAPYLDLAWAATADFLVTRDADLLWLMKGHTPFCKEFRQKTHPLQILDPLAFLEATQRLRN